MFLFYLLPFYKCFSQSSVYGQVKFTDDSSQVSYTASIFSSKDSSYIIGNWFSSAQFSLNIDTSKSVYLKIQSLGYTDVLLSLRKSSDLNVGEIFMSHSSQNNLKEIVVRADKPIYETKNGNLTVNVSSSNLVNSGTAIDVFRKIPGLIVKDDKNIEVIGRGKPLIIIDDREATYFDYQSLASDQIESIEVIRNPSAEFSASSNTVLKIKTINRRLKGKILIIGTQATQAVYFRNYNSLYFGSTGPRYSYSLNFWVNPYSEKTSDNYYRDFQTLSTVISNSVNKIERSPDFYNFLFKFRDDFNPKNSLSFQSNNGFQGGQSITTSTNNIESASYNGNLSATINSPFNSYNSSNNITFSHKLDSNQRNFKVLGDFFIYSQNLVQNIQQMNIVSTLQNTNFNNQAQVFSINPILNYPFPKKGVTFDLGFKYSDILNQSFFNSFSASNNQIQEDLFAAYTNFSIERKKIEFQFGLRFEDDRSKLDQNSYQLFGRKYENVFPNASFQYSINPDLKAAISYAYRVNRPNLYDLTTYVIYVDSLTSFKGNPYLVPEYSNIYDLNFSYKSIVTFDVSYVNTANPIFYYVATNGLSTSVYQTNMTQSNNLTFSLSVPYRYKFWTVFNNFGFINQETQFEKINFEKSNNMFYWVFYNQFNFGSGYSLDFTNQLYSSALSGVMLVAPKNVFSFSVRKTFYKNRFELYFNANDLFNTDIYNLSTTLNNVYITDKKFSDQHYFRLGFKVKFNQFKKVKVDSESGITDEQNRIKKQ